MSVYFIVFRSISEPNNLILINLHKGFCWNGKLILLLPTSLFRQHYFPDMKCLLHDS